MSYSPARPVPPEAARPRLSHVPFLWAALLVPVILGVWLVGRPGPRPAEASAGKVDIIYLSVTSEGPTAKAWYDGAPSPGVPVQDALDKFGKEGYRVVAVTEDLRSTIESTAFVVLLQRGG